MKPTVLMLALVLGSLISPAWADRAPTLEERARIEAVLRSQGFVAWEEIELDDDGWEIDGAVAADGRKHEAKLDPVTFAILQIEAD